MRTNKLLLWIFMVTFFLTSIAFASDFEIEKNADQTCSIVGYKGEATSLVIPSTITGYTVTAIGDWAFSWCISLTSITIPDSVTSIGDSAFSWCSSLTNITIPDSVTLIGEWAFFECTSITNIIIPSSVTSIGKGAFADCVALVNILVDEDNRNFAHIRGVLFSKINKTLHSYPAGKNATTYVIPEGILSIEEGSFYNCSLANIVIPSSVISIGYGAFADCNALANIQVDKDNQNFEHIHGVLFDKKNRILHTYPAGKNQTSYIIPAGTLSIGKWAFYNCSLTSIIIPDSITSIGVSAFYCCSFLTGISIPDSTTSIDQWAFSGCSSLTSINIPENVTSIGEDIFVECPHLSEIIVEEQSYAYEFFMASEYAPLLSYTPSWL